MGGTGGQFGWMDTTTLVYTPITTLPNFVQTIMATGDDDIWIGYNTGSSGPFKLGHWDGNDWTNWTLMYPPSAGTVISDIFISPGGIIFAMGGTGGQSYGYLYYWDGDEWILSDRLGGYGNSYFYGGKCGGQTNIGPSPYVVEAMLDNPANWYARCWTATGPPIFGYASYTGYTGPVGCARLSSGLSVYLTYQGHLLTQAGSILSGPETWSLIGDVGTGGSVSGRNFLWADPLSDVVWFITMESSNMYYLYKFEEGGSIQKLEQLTDGFNKYTAGFTGQSVPGVGSESILFCGGVDGYVRRRNTDGSWNSSSDLGFALSSLYLVDFDETPPYLDNQNPEPGSVNVSINTSISLDLLDDESDIDVNETKIYINDDLLWSEDATVDDDWLITKSVVDSGYNYSLQSLQELIYNTLYSVRTIGKDTKGNTVDETFSFLTEDWPSPVADSYEVITSAIQLVTKELENYTIKEHPVTKRFFESWKWDKTIWPEDKDEG